MITRIPYDRDDLKIGKKDKVLEVGPGHNPTFRANVIVEQTWTVISIVAET